MQQRVNAWLDLHYDEAMSSSDLARAMTEDGIPGTIQSLRRAIRVWRAGDGESAVEDDAPPVEPRGIVSYEKLHFYNAADDVYVFWLKCRKGRTDIIDGETIREAKRRYSRWQESGPEESINAVCRDFGWPRQLFVEIKTEMGWTHDQDPFTDEEHEAAAHGKVDLLQDLVMMSRGQLDRQKKILEWKETVADAEQWRRLKEGRLDIFAEHVASNPPRPRGTIPKIQGYRSSFMAVFSPADVHLYKRTIEGRGIDHARAELIETTERLIARVQNHGVPEKTVLVLGNDWFHVDNIMGGTTRGTPQDVCGDVRGLIPAAYDIAAEIIDRLRVLGLVDVHVVPSNHGEWSDHHLRQGLAFGYREHDDVRIADIADRQFIEYGRNLVGLEHGDGPKHTDLPIIMAKEKPEAWGRTRYRYWLTAHLHHLVEKDLGVTVMQAPSLSGKDRWHDKKGYVTSDRGNVCYLFDREQGHTDRCLALVG
jgi:hypothetical protein